VINIDNLDTLGNIKSEATVWVMITDSLYKTMISYIDTVIDTAAHYEEEQTFNVSENDYQGIFDALNALSFEEE
jgi:hypothetical protein